MLSRLAAVQQKDLFAYAAQRASTKSVLIQIARSLLLGCTVICEVGRLQ